MLTTASSKENRDEEEEEEEEEDEEEEPDLSKDKQQKSPKPVGFVKCPLLRQKLIDRFFPGVEEELIIPCLELRVSAAGTHMLSFLYKYRAKHDTNPTARMWKDEWYRLTSKVIHVQLDKIEILSGKKHDIDTAEQHWNKKQANHSHSTSQRPSASSRLPLLADKSAGSSGAATAICLSGGASSSQFCASKMEMTPERIERFLREVRKRRRRGLRLRSKRTTAESPKSWSRELSIFTRNSWTAFSTCAPTSARTIKGGFYGCRRWERSSDNAAPRWRSRRGT